MSNRNDDDERSMDELNEEADIAADYIEDLLDILDYDGDIEMGIRNKRPLVNIVADDDSDIKNLIGKNGEVVEALQKLARLVVQEKTGERSHLILDVDGYLERKRKHLRAIALDAVEEAMDTGEMVTLDDMNSYERKIVHDVVREEGLRSRSHGEEPHRHVTVYPPRPQDIAEDEDYDDDDADEDQISAADDGVIERIVISSADDGGDIEDSEVEDSDIEDEDSNLDDEFDDDESDDDIDESDDSDSYDDESDDFDDSDDESDEDEDESDDEESEDEESEDEDSESESDE